VNFGQASKQDPPWGRQVSLSPPSPTRFSRASTLEKCRWTTQADGAREIEKYATDQAFTA
jgi:hypothetical protein